MRKIFIISLLLASSASLASTSIVDHQLINLDKKAIKRTDITPYLKRFSTHPAIKVKNIGHSFLGRPIDALYVGDGPLRVMMWSQMHGDENTATAALMDFLNYLSTEENKPWLDSWQHKISLKIIPMINPDGAELQTRFNAQGIDLNRDAKALRTAEGQTLMAAAKAFKPDFGFNLHDQNAYYGAGKKGKPATISVLAPAYNEARDINESRGNAMKLIAHLSDLVEQTIPDHLGKYNDSYSYRSFGDTFSEMGISTILIESGAYFDDPNRQVARKVNRMMYVNAIDSLANNSWQTQNIESYHAIPFNDSDAWVDLLIDDVHVTTEQGNYQIDIAINNKGRFSRIKELGDISSIRQGFTKLDASSLSYDAGKGYTITQQLELTSDHYKVLLKQGYSCFKGNILSLQNSSGWPAYPCQDASNKPERGSSAHFILRNDKKVKYAVLGGELIAL